MRPRARAFRPFASGGGRTVAAILATFALMFALSVALSIIATGHSRGRAAVVEVAARQRTLAERYVESILLVRSSHRADPATIASLLGASANALLEGGTAPAVHGDDDDTKLPRASSSVLRAQLMQELRLVKDLTASGAALLAHRPLASVPLGADESITLTDPVDRVRVLATLTSNVSLNAARTIASEDDRNITDLITMQVGLGVGGLLVSLLLAWGLIAATRRRTAHFQSLVNSSTDLVAVLGAGGCRYVSRSLAALTGHPESDLLRAGFQRVVHEDDRAAVAAAQSSGEPRELVVRMRDRRGVWRHLEAHITDLRHDRHVAGVVVNARDITERVALERELALQADRDKFGGQLVEALEMADEESSAYEVVERAMSEISDATPMELLLSDSSRSHLEAVATSPSAGAPGCPVQSPFSCVAVRRGSPVVFESSEALNACPKLRGRAGGSCSAACVPVGFMGRALGVLHVTGRQGDPPNAGMVEQLTALATQAGARIGTVRAFEKSQLQASTDALTGLTNRRTVEARLRQLMRGGREFALALADLDEFKALNDKHGHEAGDRALRGFAHACASVLRGDSIIARWGGEEFLIALPDVDRNAAATVLERLRASLAESHGGSHPSFTASFGVADSSQGDTLEQLIKVADSALYESKSAGRDRITVGASLVELPMPAPASVDPGLAVADMDHDLANPETRSDDRPRPPSRHAALHEAADEEEPGPSGLELR